MSYDSNPRRSNVNARRAPFFLCAAFVFVCSPCALAQSGAAAKRQEAKLVESKKGDAKLIETKAATDLEASNAAQKGEEAKKDESFASDAKIDASEDDASVEELRAKIEEARTGAERARLRRELADMLAERGRRGEAVAELRATLDDERFDPSGYYNAGNALARLDESNGAVEAYRKAIAQRRGNYSRAQHNLGVVLVRLGRWDEAREALSAAIRLEGGIYPEASYNLGRLYALRGESGLAIQEWTRALAHRPEHADAAIALAYALAEDGDPERSLLILDAFRKNALRRGASVEREMEIARGEIVAAMNLSNESSRERKEASNARESASVSNARASARTRGAFAVDKASYDLLQRARSAREGGSQEESVSLYRRVIERRGGYFAPANLELGFALSNLRRNEEAVEAFERVAAKDGERYPIVFYHLGRLYESANELTLSRMAFERAATLFGESNPQILLDLSRLREKSGDARGALEALENYARITARMGASPAWTEESLERLRRKASASDATAK